MTNDPRTYGGCSYPTELDALTAAYLDFLTADGWNDDSEALDHAQDSEIEANLEEARKAGWTWPGSPDLADFHKAAHRVRLELESRTADDAREAPQSTTNPDPA